MTPLPLYSEEQAASFLREKGYKVEEPPKPLSGKVVLVMTPSGNVHAITKDWYDTKQYSVKVTKVLAIVDWAEGDGLTRNTEGEGI